MERGCIERGCLLRGGVERGCVERGCVERGCELIGWRERVDREGVLRRVVQGRAHSAEVRGRFPFRISPDRIRMRMVI